MNHRDTEHTEKRTKGGELELTALCSSHRFGQVGSSLCLCVSVVQAERFEASVYSANSAVELEPRGSRSKRSLGDKICFVLASASFFPSVPLCLCGPFLYKSLAFA